MEEIEDGISKDSSIVLDLIRALAAQCVVFGHGLSLFNIYPTKATSHPIYIQDIGVLVFFILSGFLISFSLERKKKKKSYEFLNYFMDRFVRIYSAFIPALLFVLIVDIFSIYYSKMDYQYVNAFNFKTFIGNVFMLQDFPIFRFTESINITSFGSARPFWTLAVEWWFYMAYGIILLWNRIKIHQFAKTIFLIPLLIVPIFNLVDGRGNGLSMVWLFGVLIYHLNRLKIFKKVKPFTLFSSVIIFAVISALRFRISNYEAYDLLFASILATSIFLLISGLNSTNFFRNTLVNRIITIGANYSFTLYLIHYSVLELFRLFFMEDSQYLLLIASFFISNILSFVIAYFIEFRHKDLRTFVYLKLKV